MRRKYLFLVAVFALVAAADQYTKYLAVAHLTRVFEHAGAQTASARLAAFLSYENLDNDPSRPGGADHRKPPTVVVPDYWNHRYVENPGAAWGMLAKVDDRWRVPFFHLVSLLAIGIILGFYRRLERDQRLLALALSLVLGGAVGNYLDRLLRGYVIDFIDWHWRNRPDLHWPTFNIADAAICVGVFLMLAETLFGRGRPEAAEVEALPAAQAPGADARAANPDSLPAPSAPAPVGGDPGPKAE